jgi:MFS family permease
MSTSQKLENPQDRAAAMTSSSDMTSSTSTSRLSPELSRLALLLALSIFINYIDRGNLAIAAPLIKDDLGLSYSQLGVLLASFFYTYAIFQIVSGWLVDRFPVNWVLALGILLWSAATFGTGLVTGFKLLLGMRLILGIGESVAYPSYSKIISRHFSESQRGRANSLISAGQACGPAVGTLLGGMLLAHAGWRLFFVVFGVASSLWLIPWLKFLRKPRSTTQSDPTPIPRSAGILPASISATRGIIDTSTGESASATILQILQQRSAWGTFAGLFAYNYVWYFFITWLPTYLIRERQFSLRSMSIVTSLAFFILAISALASGWLSDKWIAAGATPTRVRKTFTGVGPLIASSILLVGIVGDHRIAVAILILVCIGLGMCTSNLWSVTQTLAGPATSGKWTGLQNFTGNLAGWLAPTLIGLILQRTGNYFWAFVITSMVSLLGAAAWIFAVGPIRPAAWPSRGAGLLRSI